jgi:hypothetical protein
MDPGNRSFYRYKVSPVLHGIRMPPRSSRHCPDCSAPMFPATRYSTGGVRGATRGSTGAPPGIKVWRCSVCAMDRPRFGDDGER